MATAKETGERCQRQPIPGGTVCAVHGGRAPQTVAAAKRRLLEGIEPAITRLLRIIETPPGLCASCGRFDDTSAVVSAIRTLLDRAGLHPSLSVEVQPAANPYEHLSLDELIERHEATLEKMRQLRNEERARQLPSPDNSIDDDDGDWFEVPE